MTWEIEEGDHFPIAATIKGDGFTVKIIYDEQPESPRDKTDCNIGTMLCAYPGYNLGDEQADQPFDTSVDCPRCGGSGEDPERFEIREYRGYGYTTAASGTWNAMVALLGPLDDDRRADDLIDPAQCSHCKGEGEVALGIYDYLVKTRGATVVLPLFVYEHSGITMSCGSNMGSTESRGRYAMDSAGWDTSFVGFIFDTPESLEKTGCPPDQIENGLKAEIEEYDRYLRGDVYGVVVNMDDGTEGDSCWGFYGHEYAEEQAREFADYAQAQVIKERAERAEMAARDIITV